MATKLSTMECLRFLNEVSALSRAGVPMPEGLRGIASRGQGRVADLAQAAAAATERGVPLSKALREATPSPPESMIALVECGEQTGDLYGVLEAARRQAVFSDRLRETIATAAAYPALVVLALLGLLQFMCLVVVPRFFDLYAQLGAELPWMTQRVLSVVKAAGSPVGIAVSAAVALFLLAVLGSTRFRQWVADVITTRLGVGETMQLGETMIVTRCLARMLARGAMLPTALRATEALLPRQTSRTMLIEMATDAERGLPTADAFERGLPSTAAHIYRVGEERGDLAGACESIADYCEVHYDIRRERAAGMLEPVLLLVVGIVIATILMSLYLPLFTIPRLVR